MNRERPRVLFVSPDAVGERMAGLGIRYTELAKILSEHAEVVVATGDRAVHGDALPGGARVVGYDPHEPQALRGWIEWADTVVAPPQWPLIDRWLRRASARVVIDLYDPEALETLELFASGRARLRSLMVALALDRLEDALRTGDHFMCASETQRDLWLGALLSRRSITPRIYDEDRGLRDIIDLVPFGLPEDDATARGAGARAAFEHIGPDDEIVLWNGGIWPWLDAATAIRAVSSLASRRAGVRLVFMGRGSGYAGQRATAQAEDLARALGVHGTTVLFASEWVPYDSRADWLLGANCAIATAGDHLEARFAFRTRLLDCFWAGLPIACTTGDDLAERVVRDELGAVARPGDHEALASAVEAVLDRGRSAYALPLSATAAEFRWRSVARPLIRWVHSPRTASPRPLAGPRRPGHVARRTAYRAARASLSVAGVRWPSL